VEQLYFLWKKEIVFFPRQWAMEVYFFGGATIEEGSFFYRVKGVVCGGAILFY
jgi:hypothetical protein